jgi:hypothetical protein
MNKIGIIVPYRNRRTHLNHFITSIKNHFKKSKLDYEIIIVEQSDNNPFNRGSLLNIGVIKAKELGCTYIALHDVDMLPTKDVDYSIVDRPTHLATNFLSNHYKEQKRIIFDEYFGGVTMFLIEDYYHINGYSNKYWGWGYEDDDLLWRCKENFDDFNKKKLPAESYSSAALKFNGHTSQVIIPKPYKLKNYTIFCSFNPDEIECNPGFESDEFNVFCIPGFDTSISYNSYKRYKFETWTTEKEVLSLKSNITPPKQTVLCATINQENKIIKFYQDGELVDEVNFKGRLINHASQKEMYLGNSPSLEHNGRRPFKGTIDYFALFNHSLEESQIKEISENKSMGLTESFGYYIAPHTLSVCLDMKMSTYSQIFDISGKKRNAEVKDCNRVPINQSVKEIEIPIPWRRESTFELLYHKENGFYENKWTWTDTRKNQIHFYNKVLAGHSDYKRDGIDNVRYDILSDTQMSDYHFLSVDLWK